MLKLLLDEHISPTVADGLRRCDRLLVVSCMAEWEEGEFLGQQDSACLQQAAAQGRSEEHTSELQSHSDLVCRLLLEKKKIKIVCEGWLARVQELECVVSTQ